MKKIILFSIYLSMGMISGAFAENAQVNNMGEQTQPIKTVTTQTITPVVTPTPTTVQPVEAQPEPATFTPAQTDQIEHIIKNYLVTNPQVLVEASQALQAQQQKQMQSAAMTAIAQNKTALFDDTQSPSVGNKEAPATVVEFFDYQCGHCRVMAPEIEKLIAENKNLHVIFKELPIFGNMSEYAAKAALSAAMQPDKYYAFHNLLFTASGPLTKETVMEFAKKTGLNMIKLKKDMESSDVQKQIRDNFKLAQALKIIGTPTFVITNKEQTKFAYIPGATTLQDLQAQIKSVE